ncbi:capsular polysaccharide synthesis protein, partial [Serratia nevei]
IIRLLLLKKYGGVWMDASIFLTEGLEWITSRMQNHEAFLFYSNECTSNIDKPISENWFIVCPRESNFIQAWLREFEGCATSDDPKNYYANLERRDELLQRLTRPDYLLCYISAIVVLDRNHFNILYASSESTGHYFNYKHNWDGIYVAT